MIELDTVAQAVTIANGLAAFLYTVKKLSERRLERRRAGAGRSD